MIKLLPLLVLLLSACSNEHPFERLIISPAAKISVSSDGKYVISTHYGRTAILWDVEHQVQKRIHHDASIYSAYFIPDSPYYLWQEATTHQVHVTSISGEELRTYQPDFQVFGHFMDSNLENYYAADVNFSIYRWDERNEKTLIKKGYGEYYGSKVLSISVQEPYFLTSGEAHYKHETLPIQVARYDSDLSPNLPDHANDSLLRGVTLWDLKTGEPLRKLIGNSGKTNGIISPDARYIFTADENTLLYRWDSTNGIATLFNDPVDPRVSCYGEECFKEHAELLKTNPKMPPDFFHDTHHYAPDTATIKFINESGNFIRFTENARYGVLYHVNNKNALAYIPYGENARPNNYSIFHGDQLIATAPKAKILVMAPWDGTGIIVYRYHEDTLTFEKLWAPEGPKPHKAIKNPIDPLEG